MMMMMSVTITMTMMALLMILMIAAVGSDDVSSDAVCQRRSSSRQHDFTAQVQPRLPTVLYHPWLRVQRVHDADTVTVSVEGLTPGQVKACVVQTCTNGWGLAKLSTCDCGQQRTVNYIVDTCLLSKFEGRLRLLPEAEDYAVKWLKSTATTTHVEVKWNELLSSVGW